MHAHQNNTITARHMAMHGGIQLLLNPPSLRGVCKTWTLESGLDWTMDWTIGLRKFFLKGIIDGSNNEENNR